MFPSFIITFREILEVAIIISVVLAATQGLQGRAKWIWGGIVAGIVGSLLVAAFTESISNFAEGIGQELFNAIILFTASAIIGWTAIWMKNHAGQMMKKIKEQGAKVIDGQLPKVTISVVIALAVLREGAEIVLFTYGMLASGMDPAVILSGSIAGLATGSVVGLMLYLGIVSIPTKYIFKVTTWLLLLLSAGMASVGAKYLVAAGYFDQWTSTVWNMSAILSENSLLGQILHAMFGYSEQPMAIQIIFYVGTLALFLLVMRLAQKKTKAVVA